MDDPERGASFELRFGSSTPALVGVLSAANGRALGTLSIALVSGFISQLYWPASWLALGILATAIAVTYGVVAYAVSLNRSDRDMLFSLLHGGLHG